MVKDNEAGWVLPQRKQITKDVLDRAIEAEAEAASREHQAQEAWFDRQHGTVMLKLTDGRVFGAEPGFIPSLHNASPKQLSGLRASDNGVYLVVEDLDLHISVDGLVTRIMEESPLAIKQSGARLAGLITSPAKATASARNGRLGGRPKSKSKTAAQHG
jgi:Protein of unknown function (DUF2442)